MVFQVIESRSGAVVFQTGHESCVPDPETQILLKKAGYKTKRSQSGKPQGRYRNWDEDILSNLPEAAKESEAK